MKKIVLVFGLAFRVGSNCTLALYNKIVLSFCRASSILLHILLLFFSTSVRRAATSEISSSLDASGIFAL